MTNPKSKLYLAWGFNLLLIAFWVLFALLLFGLWQPNAGQAQANLVDGADLIYIPSGEFVMGMNYNPPYEDTTHTVFTSGYWIYQTQVTNAMYGSCVKAGKCTYRTAEKVNHHYYNPEYANHPVVYILWNEAEKYCSWAGGHLPTEAEWEKAARGPSGNANSQGDTEPSLTLINVDNRIGDTVEVGSSPENQSAYGVLDMGSNVREWVQDWYVSNSYANSPRNNPTGPVDGTYKVLKGAGFDDPITFTRSAHRLKHVPNSPGNNRGFRCVIPNISLSDKSTITKLQAKIHNQLEQIYLRAEPITDLNKFVRIAVYFLRRFGLISAIP
jgi:formylglycine-generating enzyme required for sulfatase activity